VVISPTDTAIANLTGETIYPHFPHTNKVVKRKAFASM